MNALFKSVLLGPTCKDPLASSGDGFPVLCDKAGSAVRLELFTSPLQIRGHGFEELHQVTRCMRWAPGKNQPLYADHEPAGIAVPRAADRLSQTWSYTRYRCSSRTLKPKHYGIRNHRSVTLYPRGRESIYVCYLYLYVSRQFQVSNYFIVLQCKLTKYNCTLHLEN